MDRQTTKTVDEIGQLHIEGNIIPPQWFKAIRQGKRADTVAVIILGEVFYWYRPTVIRDEATGDVKEIRRKFDGDKWQCSYQSMADRFGFTKRQCQDAAKRLRDAGLVTLELRNFIAPNGTHLSNVLFIEPVPTEIKRITFDIPCDVPAEGVFQSDVRGITPERKTYTETPTQTPTDKERGDSKIESPAPPQEKGGEEQFNDLPSQSDAVAVPPKKGNGKDSAPAVQVFREVRGKLPPKETYKMIDKAIGCEAVALDFWRKVLVEYAALGWNRQSVSGPLEWFNKRELPHVNGKGNGLDKALPAPPPNGDGYGYNHRLA